MWRKIVVLFMAGRGENRGRFRHVIGSSVIEVLGKDELGESQWSHAGQRAPLTVADVARHALVLVCSGMTAVNTAAHPSPFPRGTTIAGGSGTGRPGDDILEIDLGDVAAVRS